jgi:hypothetical protein
MHQQVIFLSDVCNASERALDKKYLHERPYHDQWSTLSFSKENPSNDDFCLWKEALPQIRALGGRLHLGPYKRAGHKIWEWVYDIETLTLFHCRKQGVDLWELALGDNGISIRRVNRYVCTEENTTVAPRGCPSTTRGTGARMRKVISTTVLPPPPREHTRFQEVLEEWGNTWMWEGIRISGGGKRLEEAIRDNSLIAVTDGSYMKDLFPNMNSCAFINECSKGRGRATGAFPEQTTTACSYRRELIGLLAIHLILLSINKTAPDLTGSVHIYLDCLGALNKVQNLPPHRIPSKCRHSDVLKNIMMHCSSLSFARIFSHVSAHQDDNGKFDDLSRPTQLNCAVNFGAKRALLSLNADKLPRQLPFPLETVSVWAGNEKLTPDTGHCI